MSVADHMIITMYNIKNIEDTYNNIHYLSYALKAVFIYIPENEI